MSGGTVRRRTALDWLDAHQRRCRCPRRPAQVHRYSRPVDASDLFDDQAMADGYAHDRPPVHAHLVERLRAGPALQAKVRTVVDVGCGGGASTTALLGLGETVLGVDPAVPMVRAARRAEPDARFVVAEAEALPCLPQSVDLLAASGTLGFVDLGAFVREADRVLADDGRIAVSDYSFGRPQIGTAGDFADRFAARWPRPRVQSVDATSFVSSPFRVVLDQRFVVKLPMTRDAYLAYAITDTGVVGSIGAGVGSSEVLAWCADELGDFTDTRVVAFDATLIVLTR